MDLPSPPPPPLTSPNAPSIPIDSPTTITTNPPPFPPATDFPPVPFFSETTYITTGSASSTSYLLRIEQTYLISGTSTSSYPTSASTLVGLPFLGADANADATVCDDRFGHRWYGRWDEDGV
ncbi:hypothetical protein XPA_004270 [Xanthoria parietina]